MSNCFSIYLTSCWITSGLKSNFTCDNVPTKAILFFFGCSEVNNTWLITSKLANQRAQKVLFTFVVYTNDIKYSYFLLFWLNCWIPCHLFASHWIRIASIVFCFVLQRTPTNENNSGTEWQGIQQFHLINNIWTESTIIYSSSCPNTVTPKVANNYEMKVYFSANAIVAVSRTAMQASTLYILLSWKVVNRYKFRSPWVARIQTFVVL